MAQDEDVLGRETKARKLFVVELSEPRPYALLPGIVSSLNKPAHQVRSGFQRSRRARGHALARMMVIDRLRFRCRGGAHVRTRARASAGHRLST